LASCGTDGLSPDLSIAAAKQGVADAGVDLPPLPERCKQRTPHADPTKATELHGLLKLEARQLDKSNADKGWCAAFYGNLRAALAHPETK